ncbi:MAG: hypothetical protein M3Q44_01710 [bacterium]|nr:hypothetical protein [bacterium]
MAKEINLLPDVTLKEERESKLQKLLTIISMAIFVVGIIAVIAVFTIQITLNEGYKKVVQENEIKKEQVLGYVETELAQRAIKSKLLTSASVITASKDYKTTIENIQSIVPDGITISDVGIDKTDKIVLNGKANNSESFYNYVKNLLDPEKGGKFFADINLGSVSTTKDGDLQFNITMSTIKAGGAK